MVDLQYSTFNGSEKPAAMGAGRGWQFNRALASLTGLRIQTPQFAFEPAPGRTNKFYQEIFVGIHCNRGT